MRKVSRRTKPCSSSCSQSARTARTRSEKRFDASREGKVLMNKRILTMALVAVVLASANAFAAIKVVATTQDLESLTREVGGDKVEVESLAKGYQDPHFVEAKPSFILKLHSTDLLVVVGRELEVGWLPALITQSRNTKIQPGGPGYLDA